MEHPGTTWDEYAVTEAVPEPINGTDEQQVRLNGQRCWRLPENGWGGLLAWVAGSHRVWRVPDRREDHTTVITHHATAHQDASRHERPRTSEEQGIVDEEIEAELADAGLPPRPRGYVWYLQLPDGLTPTRVQAAIYAELDTAADVRAAMETATARLLAS